MSISDPELLAQLKSRCPHCWALEVKDTQPAELVDTRFSLDMEAGLPSTTHLIAGEWTVCPISRSWTKAALVQ
ncbi:hypothetical protein [Nannocystis sp. SCPEA4]|uniref:hypothetical protein n=1 Tax=Nannocystis sp. SCPEA4 TaxID=2996787 RepID=UPI002271CF64|nr:hypothetical protein [Nannocystis sp. SCPEA4]MCY1055421.1 hypothetical protein [Nannocystis sp. SCPEA4]